jgi:hypothetical protein
MAQTAGRGTSWVSVVLGWLAALGAALILSSIVGAIVGALFAALVVPFASSLMYLETTRRLPSPLLSVERGRDVSTNFS